MDGRVRGLLRPVAVRPGLKIGLEDWLQDGVRRTLDHSVADRWNRERTTFPTLFRYLHPPRPLGPIAPLHQFLSELVEKSLDTLYFDGLEGHPVGTRSAVILFGQLV